MPLPTLRSTSNIYVDFPFYQTPYLPLLLSQFFEFEGISPFLTARIMTFTHHIATISLLFLIAFQYSKHLLFSFIFILLISLNNFVFWGCGSVHNSTFANTYSILGFFLFLVNYRAQFNEVDPIYWTKIGYC